MLINLRLVERGILDLIFPPHCVACHREGDYWCCDCRKDVPLIIPPLCDQCGQPVSAPGRCVACHEYPTVIDGIRSVAWFDGTLRDAIHAFKYQGLTVLGQHLGELLAQGWERLRPEGDVIVPVPLHGKRLRERGYNQSALLARELGRHAGVPVLEGALNRVRETLPQVDLDAGQRWNNVREAFRCDNEDSIRGRAVLLIDDVCTTGATLIACAEALRPHGPASVWALTLARARGTGVMRDGARP